ncbi:MAG: hypothetical protein CMJ78_08865 [Planctomycetaceae bacterium]|nr:hypothetical protein [Planctomycetaceae bacterium]
MRSTTFEKRNGRRSGQRLKQRTLSLFEPSDVYVNRARRGMLVRMLKTGTATADDAYDAANLPPGIDARCLGSVPNPLARAGIIRRAGFVASSRPERHGSYITVWELHSRECAERWLLEHPDDRDVTGVLCPTQNPNHPPDKKGSAMPPAEPSRDLLARQSPATDLQ